MDLTPEDLHFLKKYEEKQRKKAVHIKNWQQRNRERYLSSVKAWRLHNPDRVRNSNMIRNYGITLEEFNKLLQDQQGLCAICNAQMEKPCIDHSHRTNTVRGLLCHACNVKLAAVDDPVWLHAAIIYVERAKQNLPLGT